MPCRPVPSSLGFLAKWEASSRRLVCNFPHPIFIYYRPATDDRRLFNPLPQPVQRTFHNCQFLLGDMRVDHSRLQTIMPEKFLDNLYVRPVPKPEIFSHRGTKARRYLFNFPSISLVVPSFIKVSPKFNKLLFPNFIFVPPCLCERIFNFQLIPYRNLSAQLT